MARRVNTGFLLILSAVVVLLGGTAFVMKWRSSHGDPQKHLHTIEEALKHDDFQRAIEEFNVLHRIDPANKDYYIQQGDVANRMVGELGGQAISLARKTWEAALEIDPHYKPALQRLLDSHVDELEMYPASVQFQKLQEVASRLVKEDPADLRAASYVQIVDIVQWLNGVLPTDKRTLATLDALEALQKKDPSNSESLYYAGRARARLAQDARRSGQADESTNQLAKLRALADGAAAAQSTNADVSYRVHALYLMLASLDPADRKHDRELAGVAIDKAIAAVKPDDKFREQIVARASEWAIVNAKPADAERIARDNYKPHPEDLFARLNLAQILRKLNTPEKRAEAIELLGKPTAAQNLPGFKGLEEKNLQPEMTNELIRCLLDQVAGVTDQTQRTQILAKIDEHYKRLMSLVSGESIALLRLQADILQAKGQAPDALRTLTHAVALMEHTPNKPPFQFELIYQLALAQLSANQNGAAEKSLLEVLSGDEEFLPARLLLIDQYFKDARYEDASKQINILAALSPDSPAVAQARLTLASRTGDAEQAKQLYAQLPEDTSVARQYKAEQAYSRKDYPETVRLLEPELKDKPGDSHVSQLLAATYFSQDQKEKARTTLSDALAAHPDDVTLKFMLQKISGATPQQLRDLLDNEMKSKSDPFSYEVRLARTADAEGRYDEALQHLDAASKLKPNSPDLGALEIYFDVYVRRNDFEHAARTIEDLTKLDPVTQGKQYRWQLAMAQHKYAEAIALAQDMTRSRGEYAISWIWLGLAYQNNGQLNDAREQYEHALKLQSNSIAYQELAKCYYALGQPTDAQKTLIEGRNHFPNDPQINELLAGYTTDHGGAVQVIPFREQNLQTSKTPFNYYALGYTYMKAAEQMFGADPAQAGQYTIKARDTLSQGNAEYPDDLKLAEKYAELLQKIDQFDAGKKVLDSVAEREKYKGKTEPQLLLARYFAAAGRNDDAEKYYRAALQLSNNSVDYELVLFQFLKSQEKFDAALDLLKLNAQDRRIVLARLETLVNAKRYAEAEQENNEARKKEPDSYELLLVKLGIEVDLQKFKDARETANRVLALQPRSEMGLYFQALAEMRDPAGGNLKLAMDNLNSIVTRNPTKADYRMQLAEVYRRRHETERQAAQLQELLGHDPLNRAVRIQLLQLFLDNSMWARFTAAVQDGELNAKLSSDPIWFSMDARALARQGNYPAAIEKVRIATKLGNGDPQYDRQYLEIIQQSGDSNRVLSETDAVPVDGKKTWWVSLARGQARTALGDKAKAAEEFDQALALADTSKDTDGATEVFQAIGVSLGYDVALQKLSGRINTDDHWRLLAMRFHAATNDWKGALDVLQPVIEKRAALPMAQRILATQFAAIAYQKTAQYDTAKKLYIEWLDLDPSNRAALNNMAYLLLSDGFKKPQEALIYSKRAYDAQRANGFVDPDIADTHGWVLTLCGDREADEGMSILRSLVGENPDLIEARYHFGMALLKKNRPQEAIGELKIASDKLTALEGKSAEVTPELKAEVAAGLKKAQEVGGAKTDASQ